MCVWEGAGGGGESGRARVRRREEKRGEETPQGLDGQIQQLTRVEELAEGVVKTNDMFSRLEDIAFCAYDG